MFLVGVLVRVFDGFFFVLIFYETRRSVAFGWVFIGVSVWFFIVLSLGYFIY